MKQNHQQQNDDDDKIKVDVDLDAETKSILDSAVSIEAITDEDVQKGDEVVVKVVGDNMTEKSAEKVGTIKPKTETSTSSNNNNNSGATRVWTMQELYSKYPMSRGYAAGLYNFAWAQAVQNKPLNQVYAVDAVDDVAAKSKKVVASSPVNDNVVNVVDSGDEMEEGEMEEGEIDDAETAQNDAVTAQDDAVTAQDDAVVVATAMEEDEINANGVVGNDSKIEELEESVDSVRDAIRCVITPERIKETEAMAKERPINGADDSSPVTRNAGHKLDFAKSFQSIPNDLSIKTSNVNKLEPSNSGTSTVRARWNVTPLLDLHKDHDSDDLPSPTRESPPFFPLRKSAAIGEGMPNPASVATCKPESVTAFKSLMVGEGLPKPEIVTTPKPEPVTTFKSLMVGEGLPKPEIATTPKPESVTTFKSLMVGEGLPKREIATTPEPESVTTFKSLMVGEGLPKPEIVTTPKPESGTSTMIRMEGVSAASRPCVTEAIKAVSTYQQKFGQNSFFSNDQFPSPTPSEESAKDGDEDMTGEISSSNSALNAKNMKSAIPTRLISIPAPYLQNFAPKLNKLTPPEVVNATNAGFVSAIPSPALNVTSKSRDPRLRLANPGGGVLKGNPHPMPVVSDASKLDSIGGAIRPRRSITVEEPAVEGPAHKRHKNDSTNSNFVVSQTGGWLEDTGQVEPSPMNRNHLIECKSRDPRRRVTSFSSKPTTVAASAVEKMPEAASITATTTTSSPFQLKDIAVNPTILNLLKMGQGHRFLPEVQPGSAHPTPNAMQPPLSNSVTGTDTSANVPPSKSLAVGQNPARNLQVQSQGGPTDEMGKIRMKPRDPRRFLQNNAAQNSVVQSPKVGGPVPLYSSSQLATQPDITRVFINNLKNIDGTVSSSHPTVAPPVESQSFSAQHMQPNLVKVDAKEDLESEWRQSTAASKSEEGVQDLLKPKSGWGDVEHLFEGFDDKQKVAIQKERSRRLQEQNKMFAARKLCLVLDLDHTLLNSARFSDVDPALEKILRQKEEQDREKPHRHLFRFPYMEMWTKLRPGIWNFLQKASKLFEMHLYTMGNKTYATEMAKILDPKGDLFAGRVLSRGDNGDFTDGEDRAPKSKDLEGVLGMESSVVIIDDSVRVWPHNKLNLIVVERYIYFPCSRRQFGLSGPSLLEIDIDERPEEGTLASISAVIDRIHQSFFSHRSLEEVDVRNILASEQQKILGGCYILFSRVFPVEETNPQLHPLWQTAEQFGAKCTNQIDEQVTHVVANSLGTNKVNWALSTGRFVVHPGWLEASGLLYRRVKE